MKSRIDVNLELRLQEYTWQQRQAPAPESAPLPVREGVIEVRVSVPTVAPVAPVRQVH